MSKNYELTIKRGYLVLVGFVMIQSIVVSSACASFTAPFKSATDQAATDMLDGYGEVPGQSALRMSLFKSGESEYTLFLVAATGKLYKRIFAHGEWSSAQEFSADGIAAKNINVSASNPIFDVGAAADGALWCIGGTWGENGGELYRWNGNKWELCPGRLARIAVGNKETVYGVNAAGLIYKKRTASTDLTTGWEQLPGTAHSIAVGEDGSLAVIANDNHVCLWNGKDWNRIPTGEGCLVACAAGGQCMMVGTGFDLSKLSDDSKSWEVVLSSKSCTGVCIVQDGSYALLGGAIDPVNGRKVWFKQASSQQSITPDATLAPATTPEPEVSPAPVMAATASTKSDTVPAAVIPPPATIVTPEVQSAPVALAAMSAKSDIAPTEVASVEVIAEQQKPEEKVVLQEAPARTADEFKAEKLKTKKAPVKASSAKKKASVRVQDENESEGEDDSIMPEESLEDESEELDEDAGGDERDGDEGLSADNEASEESLGEEDNSANGDEPEGEEVSRVEEDDTGEDEGAEEEASGVEEDDTGEDEGAEEEASGVEEDDAGENEDAEEESSDDEE